MSYWITVNDELRSKLIQNLITQAKLKTKFTNSILTSVKNGSTNFVLIEYWVFELDNFNNLNRFFSTEHHESLTILNIFLVGWARERRTKPRLIFTGIVFVKTRGTVSTVSSSSQSCNYPTTQMFTATLFPKLLFSPYLGENSIYISTEIFFNAVIHFLYLYLQLSK